jgi:hypothetical protein
VSIVSARQPAPDGAHEGTLRFRAGVPARNSDGQAAVRDVTVLSSNDPGAPADGGVLDQPVLRSKE